MADDAGGPSGDGSSDQDEASDTAGRRDATGHSGSGTEPPARTGPREAGGRREVVVPERLYRVVTVFSTLLAVLSFVVGFTVLDMATTILSNPPGSVVVQLLTSLGVSRGTMEPHYEALALLVALVGLGLVVGSAVFYAYGTRFRAPGMGKPKDEAAEESDDG